MINEIILALIAGIFAGGIPTSILFFCANKKKAMAEAKAAEIANGITLAREYRDLAEKREAQLDQREQLVSDLYRQIDDWRKQCTEMEVWKAKNEYRICEKRGCPDRTPPTGF